MDIWVNSENTNMQMARYFEGSLSGTIRYLGARRDEAGNVNDDVIGNELGRALGSYGSVQPGSVFVTGAGELERTHNVKRIFHVASVQGQFGRGYRQIDDVGCCVTRALEKADSAELASVDFRRSLFRSSGLGGEEATSRRPRSSFFWPRSTTCRRPIAPGSGACTS